MIITAWEAVLYSPVAKDYPTAYLKNHILRTERQLFSRCYLGLPFYEQLVADKKEIIAPPYNHNLTYEEGDLVTFDCVVFQSLVDDNDTSPEDNDIEDPTWKFPDKFNSECYNEIWDEGLKYWLAFAIIGESLRYSTYQAGAKGLVKMKDDPSFITTVDLKEFAEYKKELINDAENWLDQLYEILKAKYEGGCPIDIPKLVEDCKKCAEPRKRRGRQMHFKR